MVRSIKARVSFWDLTPEVKKKIGDRWMTEKDVEPIVKEFNISSSTVYMVAAALGLPRRTGYTAPVGPGRWRVNKDGYLRVPPFIAQKANLHPNDVYMIEEVSQTPFMIKFRKVQGEKG